MREPKPFSFIYCPTGKKANNLSAKTISKWYFMKEVIQVTLTPWEGWLEVVLTLTLQ